MDSVAVVTSGLPVLRREQMWSAMERLVLNGLSSPHTRRAYSQALEVFVTWFCSEPGRLLTKAVVQEYRVVLERKGLAPSSINVCLAAIRKFALEACDNGLLAPEIASAISRVKGAKQAGVRLGQWLDAPQSEQLLRAPDVSTTKGRRDAAILAVLVGGGLRRSEVAAVTFEHIQQREERWVIADLRGKGGALGPSPSRCGFTLAFKVGLPSQTFTMGASFGHWTSGDAFDLTGFQPKRCSRS